MRLDRDALLRPLLDRTDIRDGEGAVILAGDASYTEANLIAGKVDGVSESESTARDSLAKLREFALSRPTIYLPTHDPQTPERLECR